MSLKIVNNYFCIVCKYYFEIGPEYWYLNVGTNIFVFLGPIVVEVDSSDDEPLIESVGKARMRLSDETSAASPKSKDQK